MSSNLTHIPQKNHSNLLSKQLFFFYLRRFSFSLNSDRAGLRGFCQNFVRMLRTGKNLKWCKSSKKKTSLTKREKWGEVLNERYNMLSYKKKKL